MKRFTGNKQSTKILMVALAVVVLLPFSVGAETLVNPGYTRGTGDDLYISVNGVTEHVLSVEFKAQVRDNKGNLVNGGQWFTGFCVDPTQNAQIGGTLAVTLVAPSQDVTLAPMVKGGMQEAAWLMENRKHYTNTAWTAYESAALQVAIWEVIVDYNQAEAYNLADGIFKLGSANQIVKDLANFYLQDLKNNYSWNSFLDSKYKVALSATAQDWLLNVPGDPVATPEPGTLLLLGGGLLGLFATARKRIR